MAKVLFIIMMGKYITVLLMMANPMVKENYM